MNKEFIHHLNEAIEAAETDGFDRIELVHEDRDLEICFYKGDTGVGNLANEYKECLWQLTQKDIAELKSRLQVRGLSLQNYNHFGENARKLIIILK